MATKRKPTVSLILAVLAAGLMGYSVFIKGWSLSAFRTELGQSPMLTRFVWPVAYGVLIVESAVAVLVILPWTRLVGFYAFYTLMFLFTGYIAVLLTYGGHVPCACGGVIGGLEWWQHLVFNLVFVGLSVAGVFLVSEQVSE